MRKRGALARALVLDPAVVLCDEPSSGLDPITSNHLDDLILKIRDTFRTTFVVVTHELRSIERIADRVLVLREGRLHFSGTLAEVLSSTTISSKHFSSGRLTMMTHEQKTRLGIFLVVATIFFLVILGFFLVPKLREAGTPITSTSAKPRSAASSSARPSGTRAWRSAKSPGSK